MLKKIRRITFSVDICVEKDGDTYYAHCPALVGVHVDGETEEQALENAKVAIQLYVNSLINHGDPIPIQIIKAVETDDSREVCHSTKSPMIPCPPRQIENVLITV